MANVKKIIEIIFAGDDRVSGVINTVSSQMVDFGDQVHAVAEPLSDVADKILKIDAALLALGAVGLTYAYIKSGEFESAVIELRKVLGDHPAALEAAKVAAFELSAQYGESSSDVLLSTANFKQAGFDIRDSIDLTKTAMDLSIAGSLGSAEASELLISTLKGFKAPASDAVRLIDVLNEVSNNYATNVRELGVGMATLSPIANLMGFSFEETAGLLTPVIEIFRSGTEASVALKMGLLRLVDDSKPVQEALTAIGVSQRDANGMLRSGKDILYDVATAFQTAAENDKLFLAAQLVGIRQAGKMVEVFDGLAKSTEITSIAMGAAGSAALEVSLRLKSAEIVVARFKTGFNNLAIIIGDQFLEAAKVAIGGATEIENSLQEIIKDETFKPVFDVLEELSNNLGQYLSEIALAMPEAFEAIDWSRFLDALGDLGGDLEDFLKDLDLTDPEDLAKAIQFVVDSMESLIRITKGMVEVFKPILFSILETIKGFNTLDDATKESSGNILAVAKAITDLGIVLASVLVAFGKHADTMETIFSVVINSIGFLWETAVITVKGIQLLFFEFVKAAWELVDVLTLGLSDAVKSQIKSIEEFQSGLKDDVLKSYSKQVGHVGSLFASVTKEVQSTSKEIGKFPKEIETEVKIETEEALYDADYMLFLMDLFPELVETEVKVDTESAIEDTKRVADDINDMFVEVDGKMVEIEVETSWLGSTPQEIKEDIESIPSEKLLEIQLKGEIDTEIARIKASADTMQTSVEWVAKLNIAEVEANADIMDSIFESLSVTIESTGNVLSDLFELLGDDPGISLRMNIEAWIREESEMRREAHDMQMKLSEEQLGYMELRADALERGDSLISVTADGLEPELEAFMWRILEKVQIRVIEEQADFLLGIT